MKNFLSVLAAALCASAAHAVNPAMARVEAVELLDKATMYAKTPLYLGVSCRTAPEGEIGWLKQVKLGDTVFLGKHSFKVGVIEAVSFSEDLRTKDGRVLAHKGDTQCAIAANEKALPYDKKRCDALWVFTPKCRVLSP